MQEILKPLSDKRRELVAQRDFIDAELAKIDATLEIWSQGSLTVKALVKPKLPAKQAKRTRSESGLTIKEMVINILGCHPLGLEALEIIDKIKDQFDKDVMRTSLSPQLSRLKADGILQRDNFTWTLVKEKPSTEVEGSKEDLGEGRSGARLPIHSASGSTPDSSIQNSERSNDSPDVSEGSTKPSLFELAGKMPS